MARKTIELEVPTSLADIKLWQYQKYMKILDAHKDQEQTEELTNFLNMKLVEIFCNISLRDVSEIPYTEYGKILDILNQAFSEKPKLINRFMLLDVDMGFVPKLDDISLGNSFFLKSCIVLLRSFHIKL